MSTPELAIIVIRRGVVALLGFFLQQRIEQLSFAHGAPNRFCVLFLSLTDVDGGRLVVV